MRFTKITILFFCFFTVKNVSAQDTSKNILPPQSIFDSASKVPVDTVPAIQKDTLIKPKHDPNKATIRSAIIPGWGQAYNREYWKIPIVYAAIGIPAGLYVYNHGWYVKTRDAYNIVVNEDTTHYSDIDPKLQGLSAADLQYYRNEFRRNSDYSILFFIIAWGLNVVDATVFGHLKDFDVSDDLSMNIQPRYNPFTKTTGLGLVFNFKTPPHRAIPAR